MVRKMRMMGGAGDKTLAEWDTETVSKERLSEIEAEFNEKMEQGYFAADITGADSQTGTDAKLIREFNPKAEILLIPRVQGGCWPGVASL